MIKDYKKTNGYSVENKVIAQKIKHMLENGEEVKDHGSLRPCRAGDFCILVQKNDGNYPYGKSLEEVGLSIF